MMKPCAQAYIKYINIHQCFNFLALPVAAGTASTAAAAGVAAFRFFDATAFVSLVSVGTGTTTGTAATAAFLVAFTDGMGTTTGAAATANFLVAFTGAAAAGAGADAGAGTAAEAGFLPALDFLGTAEVSAPVGTSAAWTGAGDGVRAGLEAFLALSDSTAATAAGTAETARFDGRRMNWYSGSGADESLCKHREQYT